MVPDFEDFLHMKVAIAASWSWWSMWKHNDDIFLVEFIGAKRDPCFWCGFQVQKLKRCRTGVPVIPGSAWRAIRTRKLRNQDARYQRTSERICDVPWMGMRSSIARITSLHQYCPPLITTPLRARQVQSDSQAQCYTVCCRGRCTDRRNGEGTGPVWACLLPVVVCDSSPSDAPWLSAHWNVVEAGNGQPAIRPSVDKELQCKKKVGCAVNSGSFLSRWNCIMNKSFIAHLHLQALSFYFNN